MICKTSGSKFLNGQIFLYRVLSENIALNMNKIANADHVVHRYLNMYFHNQRQGSANSKTKSEIRGGGKKPYTQKKTGNARRGTIRSPLFPGGGMLFGPKSRNWSKIITIIDNFSYLKISRTKNLLGVLRKLKI